MTNLNLNLGAMKFWVKCYLILFRPGRTSVLAVSISYGVDQLRDILQRQDCAEEEMREVQAEIDESNDEDQSRA